MANTPPTLIQRLQALPPELFDCIYCQYHTDHVSSYRTKRGCKVLVTPEYKFPSQLHLDTVSRRTFALRYYHNTMFAFQNLKDMFEWVVSIPAHHRELIRCMKWKVAPETAEIARTGVLLPRLIGLLETEGAAITPTASKRRLVWKSRTKEYSYKLLHRQYGECGWLCKGEAVWLVKHLA